MDCASVNPKQARNLPWTVAAFSLFLAIFITPMFMCGCGHLGRIALPVTLLSSSLAWYSFVSGKAVNGLPRIVVLIAVIAATLLLFKNVTDILWFGHSPVFEGA